MVIEKLKEHNSLYEFHKITLDNVADVYALMKQNTYYYEKCEETCSLQYCVDDISNLPPNKTMDDKGYYGIYQQGQLVAVLDYVIGYPQSDVLFLGLFMLDVKYHKKKVGTAFIQSFLAVAKEEGFHEVRLMCYKNNEVGANFWKRNGFEIQKEFCRENDHRQLYQMSQIVNKKAA